MEILPSVTMGVASIASDVRVKLLELFVLGCLCVYPCLFLASVARGWLRLAPAFLFAVVLIVLGAFAEATFFLTMISTTGAKVFVWLAALCGAWTTTSALRGPAFRRELATIDVVSPFTVTAFCGISYAAILCLALPDGGALSTATMTWLKLAVDNIIPHLLAVDIAAHAPPAPFIPGWQSSDRPPLQAGFDLMFAALLPLGKDEQTRYQATSMLLQATIFGALFTLCRTTGASNRRAGAIIVLAWLSGFFFANTVFVWPKLLAATFIAISTAFFLEVGPGLKRYVAIGVSAGFGLLSHGGVVFTIPLLLIAWVMRDGKSALRPILLSVLAAVAVTAPWTWYQRCYDPPGDRLLKWHLAGQDAVSSDPFFPTFVRAYTTVPPATLLRNRLDNLATLVGVNTPYRQVDDLSLQQRQFRILPSVLGALVVPYVAAFFFLRSRRPMLRAASGFAWIALGANIFWACAMYNPSSTVVHLGSYFTVALMFVAAGLVATQRLAIYLVVLLAQAVFFAVGWLPTSAFESKLTPARWCDIMTLLCVGALMIALVRGRLAGRRARRSGSPNSPTH